MRTHTHVTGTKQRCPYSGYSGFVFNTAKSYCVVYLSAIGSYLHLLVHFYIDGFDFVQLIPQSDQCVLLN